VPFTLWPLIEKGERVPDTWMARFKLYRPDGTVWPAGKNDKGSRKRIKAKTEPKAREEAAKYEAHLIAKFGTEYREKETREREAAERVKAKVPLFGDWTKSWLRYIKPDTKPSSYDSIVSILDIHLLPFLRSVRLDLITNREIAELRVKFHEGGYPDTKGKPVKPTSSQKTINNRLSTLRSSLAHAVKVGDLSAMPCNIEIPPVEPDEAAFYTPDVYGKLCEAALGIGLIEYNAVLLAGNQGMRRNECISLRWSDIDFDKSEVVIRRSVYVKKGERLESTPKGGKIKRLPASKRLMAALKKLHAQRRGDHVLTREGGSPWTPKVFRRTIEKIEKAAGLEVTGRIHVLRHSFCSSLAAKGVAPIVIQALARHANIRTTERYTHLQPGALREGIDALSREGE